MRAIKLALTALNLCALLCTSTNARATFGFSTHAGLARGTSYVRSVKERLGSFATRANKTLGLRSGANGPHAGPIASKMRACAANAKSKLGRLSKLARVGSSGTLRGAKSAPGAALMVTGVGIIATSLASGALTAAQGIDPVNSAAGIVGGFFVTMIGAALVGR